MSRAQRMRGPWWDMRQDQTTWSREAHVEGFGIYPKNSAKEDERHD